MDEKIEEIIKKYSNITPVPVVNLANDLGLKVYLSDDFSPQQSGSLVKEKNDFVIYVNKNNSPVRRRFTVAHEIAHYILHKDQFVENSEHIDPLKQIIELKREDGKPRTVKEQKIETEANSLAAKILMPDDSFRRIWQESDTIEQVADRFEVSQSAASYRGQALLKEAMI